MQGVEESGLGLEVLPMSCVEDKDIGRYQWLGHDRIFTEAVQNRGTWGLGNHDNMTGKRRGTEVGGCHRTRNAWGKR